ncbi:hypothetical protein [Arthrobacter sp. SLBN-53]|uniref:hypothetical protein n=1 Tax=Arthrobacter sp. SLBN-53 TaxID=2768412 RepID=UPI001151CD8C|nr:hypothetical protein [Arthrobacter sp. SLBN-53]TQK29260.1 hypothetical protein FBY28_2260 [Arthrobacter sp. SLBN-53]
MQLTMKPYVTVGVALVGASVIAVAPIAPRADLHLPTVNLTASIDNPITVFTPVVHAAGDLIRETLQTEFADPFPILRQIFANQEYTVRQLLAAVNGGGAALTELVQGLPAALQAAGAILRTGDVNGAIDSLVASGLNPILNFITGVTVPLQAALERPFAVGQELVGAAFESGLALTVALAQTFIGIGFPVGTTPVLQNFVNVTQSILESIATLDPINVINALQNGVADVLLNTITHISDFMVQTVPYIRGVIVDALKAGQPTTVNRTAEVASVPAATADTVTISIPGTETTGDGGAQAVTPVVNAEEPASAEPAAQEPAETAETDQEAASDTGGGIEDASIETDTDVEDTTPDLKNDLKDELKNDTTDDVKGDTDSDKAESAKAESAKGESGHGESDRNETDSEKGDSGSISDSGSSDSGSRAAA